MRHRSFLSAVLGMFGLLKSRPAKVLGKNAPPKSTIAQELDINFGPWDFQDWMDWLQREAQAYCGMELEVTPAPIQYNVPIQHNVARCRFSDEVCASIDVHHELMGFRSVNENGVTVWFYKPMSCTDARELWHGRLREAMKYQSELTQ